MNFFIETGHNIQTPVEMNTALCSATQLCGVKSNVLEITKAVKHKSSNLINKAAKRAILKKVHNIVYDNANNMFRVWQYEGIGEGKLCPGGELPPECEATELIPFSNAPCGEGSVSATRQQVGEPIPCTKPHCVKLFKKMEDLQKHLDTGKCQPEATKPKQLHTIRDMWTNRYTVETRLACGSSSAPPTATEGSRTIKPLKMGWAIPVRSQRKISERYNSFENYE